MKSNCDLDLLQNMCTISVSCPLCSHTSFTSVSSLRISLIKAINSPLQCPICPEVLIGLDKLTLHLITHNNLINCEEIKLTNCCKNQKKIEDTNIIKSEINLLSATTNTFHNPNDTFKLTTLLEIPTNSSEYVNPKVDKQNLVDDTENVDFYRNKIESLITENHNKLNDKIIDKTIEPKCDICGILFGNYDVLEMHTKVMHQNDFNNCTITLKSENMNDDTISIATNNNNNSLKLFPCHLCTKSYKMKARLRLHLKVKHLLGFSGCTDKTTSKLNICEKIRMINIKQQTLNLDLNNIQKINNSPPPATITKLNFNQQNADTIQNSSTQIDDIKSDELLIENGQNDCSLSPRSNSENSKTWKCDYCSKFYTTKYFLKKHKRIHTGETPYTCEICKKSFTFQQSYHKHLLYHSDEKPHICVTCGRAFKELSTLHNHERIHSGEKPFECETCGKRFRQRVSNYVHQRTHTGVKPYTCQLCQKTFRYKVTLRTHKCTGDTNVHQPAVSPSTVENLSEISDKVEQISAENDNKLLSKSEELPAVITSPIQSSDLNEDSLQKLFQNTSIFVNSTTNKITEENDNIITSDMNEEMLSKTIDEIVAESCRNLFKEQTCGSSFSSS